MEDLGADVIFQIFFLPYQVSTPNHFKFIKKIERIHFIRSLKNH